MCQLSRSEIDRQDVVDANISRDDLQEVEEEAKKNNPDVCYRRC